MLMKRSDAERFDHISQAKCRLVIDVQVFRRKRHVENLLWQYRQLLDPDQLTGAVAGVFAAKRADPAIAIVTVDSHQLPAQANLLTFFEPGQRAGYRRVGGGQVHIGAMDLNLPAFDRQLLCTPEVPAIALADVDMAQHLGISHRSPAKRQVGRRELGAAVEVVVLTAQNARFQLETLQPADFVFRHAPAAAGQRRTGRQAAGRGQQHDPQHPEAEQACGDQYQATYEHGWILAAEAVSRRSLGGVIRDAAAYPTQPFYLLEFLMSRYLPLTR